MRRVAVKFLAAFDRYNGGEVAGFLPEIAKSFIDRGLAVAWSQEDEDAAALKKVEVAAKAQDLDAREADVVVREADLAAREAKLAALSEGAPKAQGKGAPAADKAA